MSSISVRRRSFDLVMPTKIEICYMYALWHFAVFAEHWGEQDLPCHGLHSRWFIRIRRQCGVHGSPAGTTWRHSRLHQLPTWTARFLDLFFFRFASNFLAFHGTAESYWQLSEHSIPVESFSTRWKSRTFLCCWAHNDRKRHWNWYWHAVHMWASGWTSMPFFSKTLWQACWFGKCRFSYCKKRASLGQLWTDGSNRGPEVGQEQHSLLSRRPTQRDNIW